MVRNLKKYHLKITSNFGYWIATFEEVKKAVNLILKKIKN